MTEFTDDDYLGRAPDDPVGLSRFLLGGNRRHSEQSEPIDTEEPASDADRPETADAFMSLSRGFLDRR